jgi:vacuolar-type H+-ATPase subunit E/Vma4
MAKAPVKVDELLARKSVLQQRIEGYKESLATVSGPCSRSSLRQQLEECEMALEQVRSELGEI